MSENTAHKPKIKKRSSFPLFPPKPSGADDWFYTFMCMNIPVYGWKYMKRLLEQEPEGSPQREFAAAYLYYKRVFLRISLLLTALLALLGLAGSLWLIGYMTLL